MGCFRVVDDLLETEAGFRRARACSLIGQCMRSPVAAGSLRNEDESSAEEIAIMAACHHKTLQPRCQPRRVSCLYRAAPRKRLRNLSN